MNSVVIMGVAGCGKSSLGMAVAQQLGLPMIEGDDHHSAESRGKMQRGIALADADRAGWLAALGLQLQQHPGGLVLTCSALKRSYREQLRHASPGLQFVYLHISREDAVSRVAGRGASHFFSATLVDSQFDTLEEPSGEPGVLRIDALQPLAALQAESCRWLMTQTPHQDQRGND